MVSFRDRVRNFFFADDEAVQSDVRRVEVHVTPMGSSGTSIQSGYFDEDYLGSQRGKDAADLYDKMRRSDSKVKMVLNAVKNPIKSATWDIEGENEQHVELVKHILFNDMDKSWTQFLHEALSFIDFGYSIFEMTHKVVVDHKKFGSYNGIRSLGFRSQRTIEKWNLDPATGKLTGIEQLAYGDLERAVTIPAQYLVIFSFDKEGDNYEGISGLRTCLGPWSRKQLYLKLLAIGIERAAVPTPVATAPEGKDNSNQLDKMAEALKKHTSHQSAFLIKPSGWLLEFIQNPFDPDKLMSSLEFENKEMVESFLANFLNLGSGGGGGSYALSNDLSDFFLGGIEHVANQISDPFNMHIIPELIKMNFGPQESYPKLKASGISDKIGQEFGTLLKALVEGKILTPDQRLEDNIRKRLALPAREEETARAIPVPPPFTFADKKAPLKLIKTEAEQLEELMTIELQKLSKGLVAKLVSNYGKLPDSNKIAAMKDVGVTGLTAYQKALTDFFAGVSSKAYGQARSELPAPLKSKIKFAEIDKLPIELQRQIKAKAELLADTQAADLEKAVKFQFTSSVNTTNDVDLIENDLVTASDKYINGPSISSGSTTLISEAVNTARGALFGDPEIADGIESYTFTNGDPISAICEELAGTTFKAGDPESERFYPPLHHNCKSYLIPNFKGRDNNPDIEDGLRPSKTAQKAITLGKKKKTKK